MQKSSAGGDSSTGSMLADWFNQGCTCIRLDQELLSEKLGQQLGPTLASTLAREMPGLFSPVALFLPAEEFEAMQRLIDTIESVAKLPEYQKSALELAPTVARHPSDAQGVLMGYDFHRDGLQPKLIEINTNAGGAFLNSVFQNAQQACCAEVSLLMRAPMIEAFDLNVMAMFKEEWTRERGDKPLQRIAIVDQTPERQFLFPEFELVRQLFVRNGIDAIIVSPEQLTYRGGILWHEQQPIDLIYNRLTDFFLSDAAHQVLKLAYLENAVVLTPNPHTYAIYAHKHNLVRLSSSTHWQEWGLPHGWQTILERHIPKTVVVNSDNAELLWRARRQWFFKPAMGYGSKASYRGDKLTRSTFANIIANDYVAQQIAQPTERIVTHDEIAVAMKTDVRIYRYAGRSLLVAARLYQGQTTNMRTPGGGFAPVYLT